MTTWLDTPVSSCDHEPNARGTACQHCGIPAELVTPDELAEALMAELDAARLRAGGQTSWLDTCAACGRLHGADRPNIAHYFRATARHQWRTGSTTVNASPCSVPTLRIMPDGLYADVPYDWGTWTPPRTARTLPGITPEMIRMAVR